MPKLHIILIDNSKRTVKDHWKNCTKIWIALKYMAFGPLTLGFFDQYGFMNQLKIERKLSKNWNCKFCYLKMTKMVTVVHERFFESFNTWNILHTDMTTLKIFNHFSIYTMSIHFPTTFCLHGALDHTNWICEVKIFISDKYLTSGLGVYPFDIITDIQNLNW